MLRLISSKAQLYCIHLSISIHWIALAEYSEMSTHMLGFQSFSASLFHLEMAKLVSCSIRVNKDTRIIRIKIINVAFLKN